jgi:sugar transferase (PEP-CTERM/EpsH1 system associated)
MPPLLFLVHRIPYPPNKGDKIRSFHFLQALAQEYDVFLGCFIDDPEDRVYINDLKKYSQECFAVDLTPKIQKLISLQGLFTGEALSLPYYRNSALQAWVDAKITQHGINRALIFSSPMAQYLEKYAELNIVSDFVDVDSDKWHQYSQSKSWPLSWIYRREANRLLRYEKRITKHSNTTLFVSAAEAALFKTLAPESEHKISYVNNGVDTEKFDPGIDFSSPFSSERQNIVFTGAMDYWANIDAVKFFAEDIFPLVLQQNPEANFYIVGSKPSREVLQLAEMNESIVVTGRVEDVRPYIAYADVVIAPLRIARGIQNKVLEAMAMAKPVVATSWAMEGIASTADLRVAIADAPMAFAEQTLAILAQQKILANENRSYVQKEFSWSENGHKLCRLLAEIA